MDNNSPIDGWRKGYKNTPQSNFHIIYAISDVDAVVKVDSIKIPLKRGLGLQLMFAFRNAAIFQPKTILSSVCASWSFKQVV